MIKYCCDHCQKVLDKPYYFYVGRNEQHLCRACAIDAESIIGKWFGHYKKQESYDKQHLQILVDGNYVDYYK